MDLSQGFLEVEVFVLLLGGDACVTAGGQAPVVGLDLGPVHQLDLSLHVAEFGLGKTGGEPAGLFPEVTHLLEVRDRQLACLIRGLAQAGDVATIPGIALFGATYLLAGLDQAGGELVEQVTLFDQVAAGLGQRGKSINCFFECAVGGLLVFPRGFLVGQGLLKPIDIGLEDGQGFGQFLLHLSVGGICRQCIYKGVHGDSQGL